MRVGFRLIFGEIGFGMRVRVIWRLFVRCLFSWKILFLWFLMIVLLGLCVSFRILRM